MADLKVGKVVAWQRLSPILATFQMVPENGSPFREYQPGQYIALRREHCRLTKPVVEPDGRRRYVRDVCERGEPKVGPVTHSYSIASAPFETRENGHLEFYIVLERDGYGTPGRLSSSLFTLDPRGDDVVQYVNRITGSFTLARRAEGSTNVVLIGTGTGLAPFVSMMKQLHYEATLGGVNRTRYTLIHTNRTREELAFHQELLAIEASGVLDFVYISSVSRPTALDLADPHVGRGRANNVLRHILGLPLKEEERLQVALASGDDPTRARTALAHVTAPMLPGHVSRAQVRKRLEPGRTVIMTCGNPSLMADIKQVAGRCGIRFEKEDW